MNRMNLIGKNIKRYREKMGITQSELAARLYISFQAVSAWERGQSIPDLENAIRLAEMFSVPLDLLLREDGEEICIGIDGGGTKTEFCAFLPDGTVKKRLVKSGSNPNDLGEEGCLGVLIQGVEELLAGQRPKRIFAGIAGASVGNWRDVLSSHLQERFGCECVVDSDAANVLSLSADPENSAMVICGTGSCVFVRKGEKVFRLGGWGQLFDESGSAYDVGKDAIRHALSVCDGFEEKSRLSALVEEELGREVFSALSEIYGKGRAYIASFATLVIRAAAEGDAVSRAILEKNADRLGFLLRCAKERFGTDTFIRSGGFFKNEIFCEMVEEKSRCKLLDPVAPPVCGACIESLRRAGVKLPDNFREKFTESYRRL